MISEGKDDEAEELENQTDPGQRRGTFVGTPQYVSPEMLD